MSVKTFKEGIKLEPQSSDPSATEGQVQFSDGTARPKGLFQYKDGAWSSIGGGAGDADTIHLIKANDSQASDFSIKSIDDIMPDPEGSDTLAGTFSIPTTGSEALLSNDDDHKVFKFASAASSQYDAFGITKGIPRYVRGEDVVLQFKYRTADTSGDSADADYMIWVWDKTNGVNQTTTSSGSVSAGTAITLGDTTGMAVGDKIWVGETGGTSQVTEAHITEVTSGTQIKISETVNLTSGDRFVTGILTDVLTTLDAADDDTNKTGNDYKVVFNVPSDCQEVTLLFQQLTSQTDSFLYVDNILVSSEVVKRVFAKDKPIVVRAEGNGGTAITAGTTNIDFTQIEDTDNAFDGTTFTAPRDGYYSVEGSIYFTATGARRVHAYVDGTDTRGLNSTDANNNIHDFSGIFKLSSGEALTFRTQTSGGTLSNSTTFHFLNIVEVAQQVNDVVVVESTDSVISDWTDYTPTFTGFGTPSGVTFSWRRVGKEMEVRGIFTSGTPTAVTAYVDLPSGYYIDSSVLPSVGTSNGLQVGNGASAVSSTGGNDVSILYNGTTTGVGFSLHDNSGGNPTASQFGNWFSAAGRFFTIHFKVPIAGWDANPKPLLSFPTVTYGQDAEHYRADGAAGYGSTDTKIPYFTNERVNTISNLGTISNDSTNGLKVVATKRCLAKINYYGGRSGSTCILGLSLDSNQLTTAISSISAEHRLNESYTGSSETTSVSAEVIMEEGQVLRPHNNGDTISLNSGIQIVLEPLHGVTNQAAIIAQPVAFVEDRKAAGTDGGGFTSGSWQTRDLNTLSGDIAAVGVTLSSNQFTLPAGKYLIEATAPAYNVYRHYAQLYNITDSKSELASTVGFVGGAYTNHVVDVFGVITITKSTTFDLRHRCSVTAATNGFGVGDTDLGQPHNVFSKVKITRLK